jgi:LAO/AO transport system kinase
VVVVNPGWGDAVQAAKAGLMEIADIFVVNKADRPGAERVRNDIELMLGMRGGHAMEAPAHHGVDLKAIANPGKAAREAARKEQADVWTPPVVLTVAHKGDGIADLTAFLDRHHRYLEESGELRERRRRRLREQVMDVAEQRLRRRLWNDRDVLAFIDGVIPRIENGDVSPYGIADELLVKGAPAIARTSS